MTFPTPAGLKLSAPPDQNARTRSPWEKTCCPSAEMRNFLREYLPDEFLLTMTSRSVLSGYWHVTPNRLAAMSAEKKQDGRYQEAIRLTWPLQSLWDDNYKILPVSFDSCHQCMRIPIEGLSYQAELGWISGEGYFTRVLSSNASDYPKNFSRPFPRDSKPAAR